MDYKTFISGLQRQCGRDTAETERLTAELVRIIRAANADLDSVAVPGFGMFVPEKHDEYVAVDSESGKSMLYPPHVTVKFNAGSMLKKRFCHE